MISYLEIPRLIINKNHLNENNFKEKIKKNYGILISLFQDNKFIDIEGSFKISKNYKDDIIKFTKKLLLRNNQYNNLSYNLNFVSKPEKIYTKNDNLEDCFKKFFIKGIHGLMIRYDNDCYIYSADNINDYRILLKNKEDILFIERFKCQTFKENDKLILEENTYLYLPLLICYCYYINLIK